MQSKHEVLDHTTQSYESVSPQCKFQVESDRKVPRAKLAGRCWLTRVCLRLVSWQGANGALIRRVNRRFTTDSIEY